jgi:hypothetical protein
MKISQIMKTDVEVCGQEVTGTLAAICAPRQPEAAGVTA